EGNHLTRVSAHEAGAPQAAGGDFPETDRVVQAAGREPAAVGGEGEGADRRRVPAIAPKVGAVGCGPELQRAVVTAGGQEVAPGREGNTAGRSGTAPEADRFPSGGDVPHLRLQGAKSTKQDATRSGGQQPAVGRETKGRGTIAESGPGAGVGQH